MILYTILDTEGRTVTLDACFPFWTHPLDGNSCAINHHPWIALDVYTPADLMRFGIRATAEADPPLRASISRMQAQLEPRSEASPTSAGKTAELS
jgi:hypothetical protein